MSKNHIVPTVLFSSTFVIFVALCIVKSAGGFRVAVDKESDGWISPSQEIVVELLDKMRERERLRLRISEYDALFQRISEVHGTDWLLMSAIAHAESRFSADAVSHYGARGLMQVVPTTAAQFGITEDMLHDPEMNIWAANRVFNHILEMLSLPSNVSDRDKICLTLAAYNCGIGRIFDAQRLARHDGRNPYRWSNISHYLTLLNDPEYYNSDQVYHGRFSGARTTRAYVNNVLRAYDKYKRSDITASWSFVWR